MYQYLYTSFSNIFLFFLVTLLATLSNVFGVPKRRTPSLNTCVVIGDYLFVHIVNTCTCVNMCNIYLFIFLCVCGCLGEGGGGERNVGRRLLVSSLSLQVNFHF